MTAPVTALDRLRWMVADLDYPHRQRHNHERALLAVVPVLLDLVEAAQRWRDAKCPPDCVGDNHVDACSGNDARADMLHTLNRIEAAP